MFFPYLRESRLYVYWVHVVFHVAPQCSYRSPGWTNQTREGLFPFNITWSPPLDVIRFTFTAFLEQFFLNFLQYKHPDHSIHHKRRLHGSTVALDYKIFYKKPNTNISFISVYTHFQNSRLTTRNADIIQTNLGCYLFYTGPLIISMNSSYSLKSKKHPQPDEVFTVSPHQHAFKHPRVPMQSCVFDTRPLCKIRRDKQHRLLPSITVRGLICGSFWTFWYHLHIHIRSHEIFTWASFHTNSFSRIISTHSKAFLP